jgi:hypothetical protein
VKALSRTDLPEPVALSHEGSWYRITNYFGDDVKAVSGLRPEHSVEPVAQLVETGPESPDDADRFVAVAAHFHLVRQFQVFVGGDDPCIGKRPLSRFDFHYVDPSTPYGPFIAGKGGVSFFTLRPRGAAPGIYWMPGSRDEMTGHAGRNIVVSQSAPTEERDSSPTAPLIDRHDDGLAAFRLAVGAGETVTAPDPAGSGGQYYLVMEGALVADGAEYPPLSLLWVEPEDAPIAVTGGPEGASVLVMQFPIVDPAIESTPRAHA